MKLELILRLLDNDELSPEQVNDVKDFLDDYVERNQVFFIKWSYCLSYFTLLFFSMPSINSWLHLIWFLIRFFGDMIEIYVVSRFLYLILVVDEI